jgi:hypothetical protein
MTGALRLVTGPYSAWRAINHDYLWLRNILWFAYILHVYICISVVLLWGSNALETVGDVKAFGH